MGQDLATARVATTYHAHVEDNEICSGDPRCRQGRCQNQLAPSLVSLNTWRPSRSPGALPGPNRRNIQCRKTCSCAHYMVNVQSVYPGCRILERMWRSCLA